jgi:hypothetical protein
MVEHSPEPISWDAKGGGSYSPVHVRYMCSNISDGHRLFLNDLESSHSHARRLETVDINTLFRRLADLS